MESQTTPSTLEHAATRRNAPIAVGLVLSPISFVFGAFAALPALAFALPWLKRWQAGAAAYVGGVALCWFFSLAGANPWLWFVKERALQRATLALGGPVSFGSYAGDAAGGTLLFRNVEATLANDAGKLKIARVEIDAGTGFLLRGTIPTVTLAGVRAELDATQGRLESFLGRELPPRSDAILRLEGGEVRLSGVRTHATFRLREGRGLLGTEHNELRFTLSRADVHLMDRQFDVELRGGVQLTAERGRLSIAAEIGFNVPGVLHGVLHGTMRPDGDGSLHYTLDMLDLEAVWSRYRKVDQLSGILRGSGALRGNLGDLRLSVDLDVLDLNYFHRVVMGLDERRSLRIPLGTLHGGIALREGNEWRLDQLALSSDNCTLSTGQRLGAEGSGELILDGPIAALRGRLHAEVHRGRIAEPVSWNPLSTSSLADLRPNLILLGDQFAGLELLYRVDVKDMQVECPPLFGSLIGSLRGTFSKQPDQRRGRVSTSGSLELRNGRFAFLGAQGEVQAGLEFRPGDSPVHASLRGELTGNVGEVPLRARLTGMLQRPGFEFTGVAMKPEDLGRLIFRHADSDLTPALLNARRAECTRLFGPVAAMQENPFLVKNTGKVFIAFRSNTEE